MRKTHVNRFLFSPIIIIFFVMSVGLAFADTVVVIPLSGADGNATIDEVLKGKTFSNSISKGLTGTRAPAPVEKTGSMIGFPGSDGKTRLGVSWPTPRFYTGIGILGMGNEDHLTGLIWQNPVSTTERNRQEAITYCDTLILGSGANIFSDWRLANVKELQSLIDFGRSSPALPANHPFTGVEDTDYWTSTRALPLSLLAFFVTLVDGATIKADSTTDKRAWCVRGPY